MILKNLHDNPKDRVINCMGIPDLFPSLCVLGSYLPGTTTLTNIEHLQYKESKRVEIMINLLQEFGVYIEKMDNKVKIRGNPKIVLHKNHSLQTIKDHRILMALMIFSMGLDYNGHRVVVDNVESISDSYPGFLRDLLQLGAKFETDEIYE